MKVFKIIFTQLTKPTKSVCQERNTGRWHHFCLDETGTDEGSLWLTQHLNLNCPTNPNAFQPSAVQSWKQPKPGPSRSTRVQPPDLPERATRRAGNTGQARYESSFKRAAGAGIDGGTRRKTQRTKYWNQHLENLPSPCRFSVNWTQTSLLWSRNRVTPARAVLLFSLPSIVPGPLYRFSNTANGGIYTCTPLEKMIASFHNLFRIQKENMRLSEKQKHYLAQNGHKKLPSSLITFICQKYSLRDQYYITYKITLTYKAKNLNNLL